MVFKQIPADVENIKWEYNSKKLFLEINGYLRSAEYSLNEPKVELSEEERRISITLSTRKIGHVVTTQALIPFSKKIELYVPFGGSWVVHCNNKEINISLDK